MKKYLVGTLALIALVVCGAQPGFAQKAPFNPADTRELLAFQLNDDLIQRYHNATMAFIDYGKAHPNMKYPSDDEQTSKSEADITISDMTAAYSKHPEFGAMLLSKGITPRQYVETMIILVPGITVVAMEKEGHPSAKGSPIVSAANLDYIRKNYDRLSKVLGEMSGSDQ